MSDIIRIAGTAVTTVSPVPGTSLVTYQIPSGIIQQIKLASNGRSKRDVSSQNAATLPTPLASVTWDQGKQVRVYYVNREYTLSDRCSTDGFEWFDGNISERGIKVAPGAGLAAAVTMNNGKPHVRVFYQEADTYTIKELIDKEGNNKWVKGNLERKDALFNTNLAAVAYMTPNGKTQVNLFYQDKNLFIMEYYTNGNAWVQGNFESSEVTARSPISAIISGDAPPNGIRLFWRSAEGKVVFATKEDSSWDYRKVINVINAGYKFSAVQWEKGTNLRLCYQNFDHSLVEFYSNNAGDSWFKGEQI